LECDVFFKRHRDKVIAPLKKMAQEWMDVPLLARTHGQVFNHF
jgi:adenylosuccinate lyase